WRKERNLQKMEERCPTHTCFAGSFRHRLTLASPASASSVANSHLFHRVLSSPTHTSPAPFVADSPKKFTVFTHCRRNLRREKWRKERKTKIKMRDRWERAVRNVEKVVKKKHHILHNFFVGKKIFIENFVFPRQTMSYPKNR
ncbi:hypothetical protein Drorol1_Dr00011697, partial [Drosera rotundifolia]